MTDMQDGPWLDQDGPRVEIHYETDGSLHMVLRCPSRPTEITTVRELPSRLEWEEWLIAQADRHAITAGCDCRDHVDDAIDALVASGEPAVPS